MFQKRMGKGDDPQVEEFSSSCYEVLLLPCLKKVCKSLTVFFSLGSVDWLLIVVGYTILLRGFDCS